MKIRVARIVQFATRLSRDATRIERIAMWSETHVAILS
jgi:hypothetical protein